MSIVRPIRLFILRNLVVTWILIRVAMGRVTLVVTMVLVPLVIEILVVTFIVRFNAHRSMIVDQAVVTILIVEHALAVAKFGILI